LDGNGLGAQIQPGLPAHDSPDFVAGGLNQTVESISWNPLAVSILSFDTDAGIAINRI